MGREQQENAATVFFAPDSQLLEKINGVIVDDFSIQRADRHDRHLDAGFLLEFGAQRFQAGFFLGANYPCQVRYIAGGMNAFDVFGVREPRARERGAQQDGVSKKSSNTHLGICTRPIGFLYLYVDRTPKISRRALRAPALFSYFVIHRMLGRHGIFPPHFSENAALRRMVFWGICATKARTPGRRAWFNENE
jgi:hypothetical protein